MFISPNADYSPFRSSGFQPLKGINVFNPPNADYSPFRSSGFQPLKGINVSNSPNANYSPIHGGVSLAPKPMIETPKLRAKARVLGR